MAEDGLKFSLGIDTEPYIKGLEEMQKATVRLDDFLKAINLNDIRDQFRAVLRQAQISSEMINRLKEQKKSLANDISIAKGLGMTEDVEFLTQQLDSLDKALGKTINRTHEWDGALELMKGRMGVQSKPDTEMFFGKEELQSYENAKAKYYSLGKALDEALLQKDYSKVHDLNEQLAVSVEILGKMETAAAATARELGTGLSEKVSKAALDVYEGVGRIEQQQNRVAEQIHQLQVAREKLEIMTELGADKDELEGYRVVVDLFEQSLRNANIQLEQMKLDTSEAEKAYSELAESIRRFQMPDTPMLLTVQDLERIDLYREKISALKLEISSTTDPQELASLNDKLIVATQSLEDIEKHAAELALEKGPSVAQGMTQAADAVFSLSKQFQRQTDVITSLEEEYRRLEDEMDEIILRGDKPATELTDRLMEVESKLHKARMDRYTTAGSLEQAKERLDGSEQHIHVRMTGDSTGFQRANDEVLQGIAKSMSQIEQYQDEIHRVTSSIQHLAEFSIPAFSIAGITQFLTQVKNVRANFQDIESTMRVFLGSAEKAASFVDELKEAAYYNMFDFSQLVEGSKQMIAYGVATEQVVPRLNQLSEIATATHASLGEMVGAYNRAKSLGFVDSRSMQSWATKGLVIKDVLREMGENANATRISFEQLNKVLDYVTDEGGMFHGVMNEQMQNISAEIGQLEDSWSLMCNSIGEEIQEPLRKVIKLAGELVANWEKVAWAIGGATVASKAFGEMQSVVASASGDEMKQWEERLDNLDRRSKTLTLDKKIEDRLNAGLITKDQAERWQNAKNKVLDRADSYDDKGRLKSVETLKKEADARAELADKIDKEIEKRRRLEEQVLRNKAADKIDRDDKKREERFNEDKLGDKGIEFQSNKDISDALRSGAIDSDKADELIRQRQSQSTEEIQRQIDSVDALIEARRKEGLMLDANLERDNQKADLARQTYEQSMENYGLEELSGEKQKEYLDTLRGQVEAMKERGEQDVIVTEVEDDNGDKVETIMELADAESLLSEAEEAERTTKQALTSAEAVETNQQRIENAEKDKSALSSRRATVEEQKEMLAHRQTGDAIGKENILRRTGNQLKAIGTNLTKQLNGAIKGLWATIVTNPLGMLLSAIPLLISGFQMLRGESEETDAEMEKFGKAALESKNNVETLYAVLTVSEKGSKAHSDALKELTSRFKDYNITVGQTKDLEDELIEKKSQLIALILEEGRAKQAQALIEKSLEERSALIYGDADSGEKGLSGKMKEIFESKYKDADKFFVQAMSNVVASNADAKEQVLNEMLARVEEKQKEYSSVQAKGTPVDRERVLGELNKLYEDYAKELGLDAINEQLAERGMAKLDEDAIRSMVLYAQKQMPKVQQATEATEALTKSLSSMKKESESKPVDKSNIEELGSAYANAAINVETAKDNLNAMKKEAGKPVKVKVDTKDSKESIDSLNKGVQDTKEAADKLSQTAVGPKADTSGTDKAQESVVSVEKEVSVANEGFKDSPLNVATDNKALGDTSSELDSLMQKEKDVDEFLISPDADTSDIEKTRDEAQEANKELEKTNGTFKPTINISSITAALKEAKELYGVLMDIHGNELFATADDRKTMGDFVNDFSKDNNFNAGMSVSEIMGILGQEAWNAIPLERRNAFIEAKNRTNKRTFVNVGGTQYKVSNEREAAILEQAEKESGGNGKIRLDMLSEPTRAQYERLKMDKQAENYDMTVKQRESYRQDVRNYFAEGLKKGETDEYYKAKYAEITNLKAKLRQDDPLYKELEKIQKQYEGMDSTKNKDTNAEARAYERKKLREQEALREQRLREDNEISRRELELKKADDTTATEKDSAELERRKKDLALSRKIEDEAKRLEDVDMKDWLKGGKDRKEYQWEKQGGAARRSKEEYMQMAKDLLDADRQMEEIELEHAEKMEKIMRKEQQARLEYVKEFGDYRDKIREVSMDYDYQIEHAETDWERRRLKEEKKRALDDINATYTDGIKDFIAEIGDWDDKRERVRERYAKEIEKAGDNLSLRLELMRKEREELSQLDMEELRDDINWETVFSDLDTISTQALEKLHQQLREALDVKDIAAKNAKVIIDQMREIEGKLKERKNAWGEFFRGSSIGGLIMQNRDRKEKYKEAEQNFKDWDEKRVGYEHNKIQSRGALDALFKDKGKDTSALSDKELLEQSNELLSGLSGQEKQQAAALFEQYGQSLSNVAKAQEGMDDASKVMGGAGGGMSALAMTDTIIHGVNDNIQSFVSLLDTLELGESKFGKGMKAFAESSQYATQAWESLKNGDLMGVADNAINALGTLGDALGAWGVPGFGSSDQGLLDDLEALARSNDALRYAIQELNDEFADAKFYEIGEKYNELKDDITQSMNNTAESMQRSASAYSNGFFGIKGKSSANAKIDKGMDASDWQRITKVTGVAVAGASDFFNLTSEQMHQVAVHADDLWLKIRDNAADGYMEVAQYMDEYIEYYKELEQLEQQRKQMLTDTTFDSVADQFKSMLMNMESSSEDFANSFEDMMRQAVINSMFSNHFKDAIEQWYDEWAEAMGSDGLDEYEQEKLSKKWKDLAADALEQRDAIVDAMGWKHSQSQRGGQTGGFATASQDSIDELNGRFTAVQVETTAIRMAVDGINGMMLANSERLAMITEGINYCQMYGQQHLEELVQIRKNTSVLPDMSEKIEDIEKTIRNI